MRLLYACVHPTLRKSDIEVLLSAGFEVVPSFVHIQFRGKYRIDPKESDDPMQDVNRRWKNAISIPDVDVLRMQMVDFYRVSDEPFSIPARSPSRIEDKSLNISGFVSAEDADLINKHIDVIVVQSFPNLVPNVFSWFKGIVVFRIFGNEQPGFSVWSWYKKTLNSQFAYEFFFNRGRYVSLSVFSGIVETERAEILGENRCVLNSVVFDAIQKQVGDLNWRGIDSAPKIVTNISYLDISPSWRKYYEEFRNEFACLDYDVYGKNDSNNSYCKSDIRIKNQIDNYTEYLKNYCNYRVFCNVGKLKQHSQYTPFEAAAMKVPVLFLENSAIAYEAKSKYSDLELRSLGMCGDLAEMAKTAQRCIDDVDYAITLSRSQQGLFTRVFGEEVAKAQGVRFYRTCVDLLSQRSENRNRREELSKPSEGREKRILWAFYHKTNRYEELPLWIAAGFEVVPLAMPEHLAAYQGANYDDEADPMYPQWRASCTLDLALADLVRSFQLITPDEKKNGVLSKLEADILNNHFEYIYIPASPTMALNLLRSGYKGIILNRYFGHYSITHRTLTSRLEMLPYRTLKYFNNYIWLPAMRSLNEGESAAIAPPNRTCLVSYLSRTRDSLGGFVWSAKNSRVEVSAVVSLVHSELHHYYRNFVRYFGQFNYRIYGKNRLHDLVTSGIHDPGIVGVLEQEQDLYQRICDSRVFVETGMVPYHSYYAPVEALVLQIPVVFHINSGFASELLSNFREQDLLQMGMCRTWEEMAVEVEKCLSNVSYALDLSGRQRVLVDFITKKQIVEEMMRVVDVSKEIRRRLWVFSFFPFSFVRTVLVNLEFSISKLYYAFKKLRYRLYCFGAVIKKAVKIAKKMFYLVSVLLGVREDRNGIRERIKGLLRKFD